MARKIIAKKTITFYEGDEALLQAIEEAAKADKRNFTSFILTTLADKVSGNIKEDAFNVPQETKDLFKEKDW
jgi:hypothetical protein|nr:MAG TPA: Enterocine A Immunity protein [Caudoviricetes sp.]